MLRARSGPGSGRRPVLPDVVDPDQGDARSGRRRVAVYDLYWSTLGGGEQVDGSIAQVLAADHDVTLLGPHPADVDATFRRLGVDLSACGHRRVVDDLEASEASADFDVFVNGTYLSKAINRAPLGYYYVHFPGEVPTRADLARSRMGVAGVKALSLAPEAPAAPHRGAGRVRPPGAPRRVRPTYTRYLANSEFTAGWIERLWDAPTDVLYPPVRPSVRPGEKEPLILVLGRFFDPKFGHSKKQHELLETFRGLHRAGRLPGWRMAIVGGCDCGQPRLRPGGPAGGAGAAGRRARQRRRARSWRSCSRRRRSTGTAPGSARTRNATRTASSTSGSRSSRRWRPVRCPSCSAPRGRPRSSTTASTAATGAQRRRACQSDETADRGRGPPSEPVHRSTASGGPGPAVWFSVAVAALVE